MLPLEEFWVSPLTALPIMALIMTPPVLELVLATVPVLLMLVPEKVLVPVLLLEMVRLLVPVTPPVKVTLPVVSLPMVKVPVPPVCRTIGLAKLKPLVPP